MRIGELVGAAFGDGEVHTLHEVYELVERAAAEAGLEIERGSLRHRVRSRVHGHHKSGLITRVGPSAYRLADAG